MKDLISIIVPIYNAEKTLGRCLTALVEQTYTNVEIILVNDGSTDQSLEICRCFSESDSRIKVIDKPNGGVSSARNAGLDAAMGEYIVFCDSDDWAEPDWCEALWEARCDGSLVMCGHYIEGKQSFLPSMICATQGGERYARQDFCLLRHKGFKVPWNKLYERSVIEKGGLRFDVTISNGEDYLFNLRYLTLIAGEIIFLDRCVFHYEWPTEENLSNRPDSCRFEKFCKLYNNVRQILSALMDQVPIPSEVYTDFFVQFEKSLMAIAYSNQNFSARYRKMYSIMSNPVYRETSRVANISTNAIYSAICRCSNPMLLMLWVGMRKCLGR